MIIRTISQLPKCERPTGGDLFEISHPIQGKYTSQNISYQSLNEALTQSISSAVGESFGLYGISSDETREVKIPHDVDSLFE